MQIREMVSQPAMAGAQVPAQLTLEEPELPGE